MISLIHPSRGRPDKAFKTAFEWRDSAGVDVEYIMILDDRDNSLKRYAQLFTDQDYIKNDNESLVQAVNYGAKWVAGEILVYLSDDFKCFPDWGIAIEKEFAKYSGPTLIKVDDCLQPFHVPVLTIPMMNRELYKKLGYFFHPDFKSMFVDEHLYWKAMQLGALKLAPHLKFEHCHVSVGKAPDDATYRRSAANWEQGKAMFAKHKSAGFP